MRYAGYLALAAAFALLLLSGAAADMATDTEELTGSTALQSSGIKLILNPSQPKLTVMGLSATCPDGTSEGCLGQFLMTSLRDVYEVDASGAKVSNRNANDVLNLGQGSWQVTEAANLSAATNPPLAAVPTAAFTAPFKGTVPACTSASTFPAPPTGSTNEFKFEVLLFPADTNFTAGPGLETMEVLKGNVKSTLTITNWPFCSASNKLVVEFGLKSTKLGAADAPREVEVVSGKVAEQQVEELTQDVFTAVGAENVEAPAARRRLMAKDDKEDKKPKLSRGKALDELTANGKDMKESTKAALHEKVDKKRPVSGLGRPPHAKRIFLSLPGSGSIDSKVDMPTVALIDGIATNITATPLTRSQGQGVQRVALTFPSFQQLTYDPTTAFAASDATVNTDIQTTLEGAANGAGACRLGAAGLLALAGVAGALLVL